VCAYPLKEKQTPTLSTPEDTAMCFFNSLFGHTRNWPRAYACLGPHALYKFDSMRGLQSFADYWEEKLSFLEDLVKNRHSQLPYTHRSCFSVDRLRIEERTADQTIIEVELAEIHLSKERVTIVQTKELNRNGQAWLLRNGKLEGNLDKIIVVRRPPPRQRR